MVKLAKIKAGKLSDLLKAVNKSISVHEELSRGLRDVKIVLKEALHGHKSLTIERLKRSLLEHLAQEYLAKGGGKLIYKSADAKALVGHNGTLKVEHLADLKCNACFLVCAGKILELIYYGRYTDEYLNTVLFSYRVEYRICIRVEPLVRAVGNFLYYYYVLLADINYVIAGLILNYALNDLVGGRLSLTLELNYDNGSVLVVIEVKLVRFYVYIIRKNVIKNDIFYKRSLIVLLIVEPLDISERYREQVNVLRSCGVVTLNEYDRIVFIVSADESIGAFNNLICQ